MFKSRPYIWEKTGQNEHTIFAVCLLLFLSFSMFSMTLRLIPAQSDDLTLLSSVAQTKNPLAYLVGDWGLGNNAYRPLHSILLWFSYKAFGINALPNQLFSIILHFSAILLLFRLILKITSDWILSFLLASLSLVSIYTFSSVIWVSDRPTLFVAIFFLLLLNHIYFRCKSQAKLNVPYIVLLSILALMSKESGLIVPIFAIVIGIHMTSTLKFKFKMIIVLILIILAYFLLRFLLFGENPISYSESGYLFGMKYYSNSNELPMIQKLIAFGDNIFKNLLTTFFPIFGIEGEIETGFVNSLISLLFRTPIILFTIGVFTLAVRRKLSLLQKYALAIIFLNSVIHYSVFRYRTQYLSQMAFCLFVAASPALMKNPNRKIAIKITAILLLVFSIIWINLQCTSYLVNRYRRLNIYDLDTIIENTTRIDEKIIKQLKDKYKLKDESEEDLTKKQ